ncbi:MAG: manganese efflux pump [Chloroflexi bacterium]|nr:manganese efflux pump [Chloroflexota bacterium]
MDPFSILVLAIGLGMDSFTVSVCGGMTMQPVRMRHALRVALFFGGFQALMPLLGWLGGLGFRQLITSYDHWVAFGLLALIGGKMIYEALKEGDTCEPLDVTRVPLLFTLAVATSIDALAVGLSFAFLDVAIALPLAAIGTITGAMSLVGVYLGKSCGALLQSKVQTIGGLILIGIGCKILIQDLIAGGDVIAHTLAGALALLPF